jgi:hypothetical protein
VKNNADYFYKLRVCPFLQNDSFLWTIITKNEHFSLSFHLFWNQTRRKKKGERKKKKERRRKKQEERTTF